MTLLRLSEKPCKGVNLLGTAFVETTKTVSYHMLFVQLFHLALIYSLSQIRTEVLLELAQAARKHVILVGPHASGKTSIAHHFLSSRGSTVHKITDHNTTVTNIRMLMHFSAIV